MLVSAGVEAFSVEALEKFQTYLHTSKNRTIFDPAKRALYRNWLSNPDATISQLLPKKERARLQSEKHRALRDYFLKDNQLWRKAEKAYGERVVALTYNAAQHIIHIHEAIGHSGIRKTHQKLLEEIYGIAQEDVAELLKGCIICKVNQSTNTKALLEPITVNRVLERIQIDLIDFRHDPDGRFKWIMHIKDHVSKYSALFAQTSKEASECADSLAIFIKFLGCPEICQSDNGREFKGVLLILLKRHGIRTVYGRPRTPRTQGLIEQGNAVVKNKLRKWVRLRLLAHKPV